MKIGKLTNSQLDEIVLSKLTNRRDEIMIRPGIGMDCGGVKFGDDICMLSSDPITASSADAGKLAVNVSCNDIAATGAEPIGVLITMLIPPKCDISDITRLVEQITSACNELNIEVIGGHTEVTDSVNRVVICTTAIGKAKKDKYVSAAGAQVGDAVILTKFAGIEGTSIIANDFLDKVKDVLTDDQIANCKGYAKYTSVLEDSKAAMTCGVTSMHDVTEGGVLGALHEVCTASGCGAIINTDKVPILNETRLICRKLNLDPLRLISSGCMLITTPDGEKCVTELKGQGIPCATIGKIKLGNILAISRGKTEVIKQPGRDEIYKLFEK